MFKKHKKQSTAPISLKRYFLKRFRAMIALFLVALMFSVATIFFTVYRNNFSHIKETLELCNEQASRNFEDVSAYIISLSKNNQDVTSLSLAEDKESAYKYFSTVLQSMASGLYSFPSIDGVFVYAGLSKVYLKEINSSFSEGATSRIDYKCSDLIESKLRRGEFPPEQSWFMLNAGNDHYFVKIIRNKQTYVGVWVNIEHTASFFRYFTDLDAKIFFTNEYGEPMDSSIEYTSFSTENSISRPELVKTEEGTFLAVSSKLTYSEYYITAMVPFYSIHQSTLPFYYILLFVSLLSILLFLSANAFSNHYLNSSVNMLKPVVEEIKKGNFETKIETESSKFTEIIAITDTYNEMIDEIKSLKIDIYEEQLKKQALELQILKSQLAPHFLINCLNIVFMLSYDASNQGLIQDLIKTLSNHLRYSLSKQTKVSLKDELYYTKNYLTLSQLRFPESLDYKIECDADAEDATVFPMMILLLAENAIKVNLVLGELFSVNIKIKKYNDGENERIHIICTDTGSGFDKKRLFIYNNIEENLEFIQKENHIGLLNIYSRLRIIFGDSAKFEVSNELDSGARIDMDIPYIPYSPNTEKEEL